MSEHSGKESDSVHCCDQLLPLHAHQPLGAGTLWGFCIHLCMSALMLHLLTTTTLHTTAIFCCCVCLNMPESSPKCSRCMYSVRLCQYQFLEPYPGNDDESSGFYCPQAHNLVNIKQNERWHYKYILFSKVRVRVRVKVRVRVREVRGDTTFCFPRFQHT